MGILTDSYINDVLKVEEGEEWNVEFQLQDWDDDGRLTDDFDKVVKYLTPEGVVPERKRIKITHSDNAVDLSMFLDLYAELYDTTTPITVIDGISIREVNGKRYATEYADGGLAIIYHFE